MTIRTRVATLALAAFGLLTVSPSRRLAAQAAAQAAALPPAPAAVGLTAATTIGATRAESAPVIDGLDTDPVWTTAPVQEGFREWRPTEDGDPKQRTDFRVAYDAENVYFFIRNWDTSPDSIISRLARRDDIPTSDYVTVMLDSYHDRRTGYGFMVNVAGVKGDYAISNDSDEDEAWDAIWDVATSRDQNGWTAEFKIPFSQLRFARAQDLTFGIMVSRMIQRHTAQVAWPIFRQSRSGYSSQFGELTGLNGVAEPRRLELAPYFLAQNEPDRATGGLERKNVAQVGGDLKYAVAPNITLNATINPDFGQVEADPSELNLGAFETFFSERRPFFVEGSNVFDFRINCFVVVDCSTGEGLFYSRRIGRSPSLSDYADDESATSTRILGAGKLTGRFTNGTSFGLLNAVTERVANSADQTMEPLANYSVLRFNRDMNGGNTSIGVMATGVNRDLDEWSEAYLHSSAYSGGIDARSRHGLYEFSGSFMGSKVTGSEEAIAITQQRPTHYFQRPDDDVEFDPTRTSLSGNSTELRFGKVGGARTRFETGYGRRSEGFETNDVGFLRRAGEQTFTNWATIRWMEPKLFFQRLNWNLNWWQYWTLEGLPTDRSFNTNVHTQLNNRWWFHLGGTKQVGQTFCDRNCTRGGPALKVEPGFFPWGGIEGDGRKSVVPFLWFNYGRTDGGRTTYFNLSPQVNWRVNSQFSTSLSFDYTTNKDDSQWFGNFVDGSLVTHYTFAELNQQTLGMTWRLNYTFTPAATFQLYASPFVSKGTYSRVRELADPRADDYEDRFQVYGDTAVTNNPGGFNFAQFRSNAVFRWEYMPGSTLFLVWSQGKGRFAPQEGNQGFRDDLGDLFDTRAEDRFLVKVSYWFNR